MTDMNTSNSVPKRIAALRDLMQQAGIAACIVPTADPHMSEYISDHFNIREYITGFTGSAGTAVITDSDAGLWTDSRYWLQAEQELAGSGIRLFKDGLPDTPSVEAYLCGALSGGGSGACVGAGAVDGPGAGVVCTDGRLISSAQADRLRTAFKACHLHLDTDRDLISEIYPDAPPLKTFEIFEHPVSYAGISRTEKIDQVRSLLAEHGADVLVLPMLDDIAWLLNLRGSDIPCNPVFFSFVIMTREQTRLYAFMDRFPADLQEKLKRDAVTLLPYEQFYEDLADLPAIVDGSGLPGLTVMLDLKTCSDRIRQLLPSSARVLDRPSPVMRMKAIKNPAEMDGIRTAHLQDGIAMCRFLFWLKQSVCQSTETTGSQPEKTTGTQPGSPLTELSAASKLSEFRSMRDGFLGDSFDPIVAYGPHGAIVHYSATEASNIALQPEGLLLVDSGGQYENGTTDITRTIVMGPLSDEAKQLFTAVLRGHIDLARARFRRGCTGANLDILAHQPLWDLGLDYGHGTGHGVGAFLNVHEDPIRIHWATGRKASRISAKDKPSAKAGPTAASYTAAELPVLTEGMLFSDEPGFYAAGKFGIRHENLLLCVPDQTTEYGDFLKFEPVTLVPFDLDGIDPAQMQPDEICWLNAYHERVYTAIAPHLNEAERAWLREATRPIGSTSAV